MIGICIGAQIRAIWSVYNGYNEKLIGAQIRAIESVYNGYN